MKRQLIILLLLCLGASSLRAQDTTAVRVVVPHRSDTIPSCWRRPVNDYPGLNSLMRRLANPGWNGLMKDIRTGLKLEGGRIRPLGGTLTEADAGISSVTSSGSYARENAEPLSLYLRDMEKGEVPVGPPVFVFFRLAGRLHHGFCDGLSGEERGAGPRPGGTSGEADERGVSWRRGSRSGPREGLPPTNPSPRIGTAG